MSTPNFSQLELYADCRANHADAFEFVKKVFADFPDVAAAIAAAIAAKSNPSPYVVKLENGMNYSISAAVMADVNFYLKRNEFVNAIRELRARTGFSPLDAKNALEPIRHFGWNP